MSDTLVRLSILDGELLRLRAKKKEFELLASGERTTLQTEGKKSQQIAERLEQARAKLAACSTQLEDERKQYSDREKQLHAMGGAKSAKHLSRENDRITLVIDAAEKELARLKNELSLIEAEYETGNFKLSSLKEQAAVSEKERNQKVANIDQRITELSDQRENLVKQIDPEIAPVYDRLRQKVSDPVAALEDGACSSCFTNIPLRIANPVKSGSAAECPGCGRILVASLAVAGETDSTKELI